MVFVSIFAAIVMIQSLHNFQESQVTALFVISSFILGEGRGPIQGSSNQEPVSQSHAVQPSSAQRYQDEGQLRGSGSSESVLQLFTNQEATAEPVLRPYQP